MSSVPSTMSSTIATKHLRGKLKEEDLLPSPTNQIVLSLTSAKGTNLMLRSPPWSSSPVHFVLLSFQTHLVVLELPNARASPRAGHLSKEKVHVTSLLGFGFMRLSSTSSQKNQAGSRLRLSIVSDVIPKMRVKLVKLKNPCGFETGNPESHGPPLRPPRPASC